MGNAAMEARTNDLKESLEIIAYPANRFPEQYKNLVLSSWKNTFKGGNQYTRMIDSGSYYAAYHRYITMLLNRPDAILRFAHLLGSEDTALGWSLMEGKILHYVYVGFDYRHQGIAKALVPGKVEVFTHMTNAGRKIWVTKMPDVKFNPFA
jgi:GNAT superfamily N-acetyltransferase